VPARAAKTCWTNDYGQFFNKIEYCVSSVLAPEGDTSFGPDHLAKLERDAGHAWCDGGPNFGLGETIRIKVDNGPAFRRLLVGNGYAKSPETYANYGRVKKVEITGDSGLKATLDFPDRGDLVPIDLPKMAKEWIELKIADVYPGDVVLNTCLGFLTPDFEYEEELLLKEQGLWHPKPPQ
jgi:hypothetical protein